jgi:hypothetical protein
VQEKMKLEEYQQPKRFVQRPPNIKTENSTATHYFSRGPPFQVRVTEIPC